MYLCGWVSAFMHACMYLCVLVCVHANTCLYAYSCKCEWVIVGIFLLFIHSFSCINIFTLFVNITGTSDLHLNIYLYVYSLFPDILVVVTVFPLQFEEDNVTSILVMQSVKIRSSVHVSSAKLPSFKAAKVCYFSSFWL